MILENKPEGFKASYNTALINFNQKNFLEAAQHSFNAYKVNQWNKNNIVLLLSSLFELKLDDEAFKIAEQYLSEFQDDEINNLLAKNGKNFLEGNKSYTNTANDKQSVGIGNKKRNGLFTDKGKKILHIGGAHTTHIRDLMSENNKQGFKQAVVSPSILSMSKLLEDYTVYKLDYGISDSLTSNLTDADRYYQIKSKLEAIINFEKPDIIHAHSLSSSVTVKAIREFSSIPIFLSPWNILRFYNQKGIVYDLENEALSLINKFIVPVRDSFDQFAKIYPVLSDDKWLQSGYIYEIDKNFRRDLKDTSPKILSARQVDEKYYQHLLVESIPGLIRKFPELEITMMRGPNPEQGIDYYNYVVDLIDRLGVSSHCKIVDALSYKDFYKLIKEHNIIYSLYELDMGYSITNILGITSGAAVLSDNSAMKDIPIFKDGKNIFKTSINQKSVEARLSEIISDLPKTLRNVRMYNSDFFQFDKDVLMKNLYSAYQEV